MDTQVVIAIGALFLCLICLGGAAWYFFSGGASNPDMKSLMRGASPGGQLSGGLSRRVEGSDDEKIKAIGKKASKKSHAPTLEEKFFHAGMFSVEDRKEFYRLQMVLPFVGAAAVGALAAMNLGATYGVIGLVIGALVGYQAPISILDRRIKSRSEDVTFYLPLVIEQLVIGVSSSLDIGPCIQRVVAMADERDSHNSVTELFRHAQLFMKTGVSMEEALNEVGRLSGHTELKHAFMSLSQVAKHGGEITRQLQELADSVSSQREARIEAKIKKLELEATGPVALVFCGFFIVLLSGFGMQIMKAFQ